MDILNHAVGGMLFGSIARFNASQLRDEDLEDATIAPITKLDDILGKYSNGSAA